MKIKTFYIAARAARRRDETNDIKRALCERGWVNTFDWGEFGDAGGVRKPYKDHPNVAEKAADLMLKGVFMADLVILLHDNGLEGALMEYGVARYAATLSKTKKIVVVDLGGRDSVFVHHKNVIHITSLRELYEWIESNC